MNLRGVLFMLGRLLLALTVALLVPAGVSIAFDGGIGSPFLITAGLALVAGVALQRVFRQPRDFRFGRQDAFLLVSAAWITASCVGALPYVLIKGPAFAIDALFESTSGFTTTGASVLTNVEGESQGLLLWRSLSQWLGGMGIIVLGIAILPKLAVGGMELLGAEAPGPIQEKLTPRIAQTAKLLWGIYVVFTAIEVLALVLVGMPPLEAVNHSLATMATGGFSTRNASVAAFGSPAIELIITLFMCLAGANFALHFHLLRGRPGPLLRDSEFRAYIGLITCATLLVSIDLMGRGQSESILDALRLGVFQVVSMMTTTGFATADFDQWPGFTQAVLFLLMFVGGCAGSTGGSVKVARIIIVHKKLISDLRRLVLPHAVLPVRLGRRGIPEDVVASVTTFFILFLALFALGGLLLALLGQDLVSSFAASAACLGNIGPGFGNVGPTLTYTPLPDLAKLVLVCLMIVGRLELYTILALFFLRRRIS